MCKLAGPATMAHARRGCRWSAKPIPITTLSARFQAPRLAIYLVRMKDTYAFDSINCQPAHRALSARINTESDCRHRPLDSARRMLIHYSGKRAIRAFELAILTSPEFYATNVDARWQ